MTEKEFKTAMWIVAIVYLLVGVIVGGTIVAIFSSSSKGSLEEEYSTIASSLEDEIEDLNDEIDSRDAFICQQLTLIETLEKQIAFMSEESEEIEEAATTPEVYSKERLPQALTNTIRAMDYRTITDTASQQYRLQSLCYANDIGIRKIDKYYCVALGSAYGRDLGDTWHVTLECGTEFDIIYSEFKDDGSTDFFGHEDTNYDGQSCINVLEFIVDSNQTPENVMLAGTFTRLDNFGGLFGDGGNIVKMEYTGRYIDPALI